MKKIILYTLLLSLFFNLSCYANQSKKEIRKEIKKYEKDISNNIGDKAENFYKLGVLNYKINKIKKAKTNFAILTLIEPKHYESYIYLGNIALFDNKDNEKAFLNYTKAIKANSNKAEGYYCRSLVYYYMYDFNNALKDINKALEIDKNNQFYINRKQEIIKSNQYYYSEFI